MTTEYFHQNMIDVTVDVVNIYLIPFMINVIPLFEAALFHFMNKISNGESGVILNKKILKLAVLPFKPTANPPK